MAAANVAFVPWVRQGAAAALTTADTQAPDQTVPLDLTASVTVNSEPPVEAQVRLLGPGDVVGIDPQQIVRTDPRAGSNDFEPNYLAAIEFDRPDYPWLFTPTAAGANARLRPWLVLVVVRAAKPGITLLPPGDGPLPVLEIRDPAKPAEELPDLEDSWCWAHAQASRANGLDVGGALNGSPELSLSRLLSPRILAADTDYLACVVPAFEIGRRAGLGETVSDNELGKLAPSWVLAPAPATVRVPVYHHWSFRTGVGSDFESLASLLRAQLAPDGLGKRTIDISRPGFMLRATFPDCATLPVGGALQPMNSGDGSALDWPTNTKSDFQALLLPIVNAAGTVQTSPKGTDPLLAPPLYGRWHAARATANAVDSVWFDLINNDPRHRVIAALGTRVVQEHQEALMASAWEQAANLQEANQKLRQLQLGLVVNTSLHARHFGRMKPEALMRVSSPAIARVRPGVAIDPAVRGQPGTVGNPNARSLLGDLAGTALPPKAMSAGMRRLVRPRGPVGRRFRQIAGANAALFLAKVNDADSGFISPRPSDVLTFEQIRLHLSNPAAVSRYGEVTAARIASHQPTFKFFVRPEGQPVPVVTSPSSVDTPEGAAFRAAAREHLNALDPARPGIQFGPPPRNDLGVLRLGVLEAVRPQRTLTAFARFVTRGKSDPRTPLPAPPPPDAPSAPMPEIETVMMAPTFPQPMYAPLRELSQELLLPGLERVLPNSVIGLETNRRFVDAYMVGLNHEMGRELLWRGFPTDQRGTCFAQFWDVSSAPQPRPDLLPLHQWGNRALGAATGGPQRERFVMLMRSELLRRYPTAIVYVVKAVVPVAGGPRRPSAVASDEVVSGVPRLARSGPDVLRLRPDRRPGDRRRDASGVLRRDPGAADRAALRLGRGHRHRHRQPPTQPQRAAGHRAAEPDLGPQRRAHRGAAAPAAGSRRDPRVAVPEAQRRQLLRFQSPSGHRPWERDRDDHPSGCGPRARRHLCQTDECQFGDRSSTRHARGSRRRIERELQYRRGVGFCPDGGECHRQCRIFEFGRATDRRPRDHLFRIQEHRHRGRQQPGMRAVWSFWAKPFRAHHHCVWMSPLHHLLAWVLSVQTVKAHYPDTALVTDEEGARLLVDGLKLEFTTVSTELARLQGEDPDWWVLGKLCAYCSQTAPFIHFDNDVFLWKRLPPALEEAPVLAQNPEKFPLSDESWYRPLRYERAIRAVRGWVPEEWLWSTSHGHDTAVCCGILGGTAVEFLTYYAGLGNTDDPAPPEPGGLGAHRQLRRRQYTLRAISACCMPGVSSPIRQIAIPRQPHQVSFRFV